MPLDPTQLDSLLRTGSVDEITSLFTGVGEADRKALARSSIAWHALLQLNLESVYMSEKQLSKRGPFETIADPRRLMPAAYAALLACAELPALKSVRRPAVDEETLVKILAARRPSWMQEYADLLIEVELGFWNYDSWHLVRAMVRAGLCLPPRHPNYSLGAIPALGSRVSSVALHTVQAGAANPSASLGLADLLVQHSDWLASDFWGIFEFDGTSEVSLANFEKYSKRSGDWTEALVELSNRGALPRGKLLDASLSALSRDFVQFRAGWFARFHEALKPTEDERIARLDSYLNLVASAIPPTVSFALKAISSTSRAGAIQGTRLVAALTPALQARAKSTAISALDLIDRQGRAEPALRKEVSEAAILALLHDTADVQKLALDILDRHGDRADAHLRAGVSDASGAVAASLRARLASWLDDNTNHSAHVAPVDMPKKNAPLPVALSRVDPSRALDPITDLNDLIASAAKALEGCEDADELDRLLDAFSRLCAQRPDDLARLAAPLRKRALKKFSSQSSSYGPALAPESAIAALIIAWIDGSHTARSTPANLDEAATPAHRTLILWLLRFDALISRMARRASRPLLSAPTHRGGWIAPSTLIDRWRTWAEAKERPPLAEQILALQRLAPEGRAAALDNAQDLAGEGGAAIRYALGQNCEIGENPSLWYAACRSRDPRGPITEFAAKHPDFPAYRHDLAAVTWTASTELHTYTGGSYTRFELEIHRNATNRSPTTTAHESDHSYPLESHTIIRWWSHSSPANQEPYFEEACERLGDAMQYSDVEDRRTAVFLEPLSDVHCELHDMARLTLALALGACSSDLRGHARDRLITAISDARLNVEAMSATMNRLQATGATCFARWAKSLKSVADHSPSHARTVSELIQLTLGGAVDIPPAPLRELLELLVELLSATHTSLTHPQARARLGSWRASGKVARLTKQLLDAAPA